MRSSNWRINERDLGRRPWPETNAGDTTRSRCSSEFSIAATWPANEASRSVYGLGGGWVAMRRTCGSESALAMRRSCDHAPNRLRQRATSSLRARSPDVLNRDTIAAPIEPWHLPRRRMASRLRNSSSVESMIRASAMRGSNRMIFRSTRRNGNSHVTSRALGLWLAMFPRNAIADQSSARKRNFLLPIRTRFHVSRNRYCQSRRSIFNPPFFSRQSIRY